MGYTTNLNWCRNTSINSIFKILRKKKKTPHGGFDPFEHGRRVLSASREKNSSNAESFVSKDIDQSTGVPISYL